MRASGFDAICKPFLSHHSDDKSTLDEKHQSPVKNAVQSFDIQPFLYQFKAVHLT